MVKGNRILSVLAIATGIAVAPVSMAAAASRSVTDAAGRSVEITSASRIVAIGGTVTEILYALGLEDRVVAVDVTSTYPARARAKPSVGYMRALSAEGVLSLEPDLIVAIEDSGPKEVIAVLEHASVPFVLVPKAHDGAGVAGTIRFVADAVGEGAKGAALAAEVRADIDAAAAMLAGVTDRRKAVFVLSMSGGSPLVAGSDTGAADIFALAGVDNALADIKGYKAASADTVLHARAFLGTPAARDHRLVVMSGTYLLNFGPRTAHAARDLAAAVYPELDLPPLPPRPWTVDSAAARAD